MENWNVIEFLSALTELSKKHNVYIAPQDSKIPSDGKRIEVSYVYMVNGYLLNQKPVYGSTI